MKDEVASLISIFVLIAVVLLGGIAFFYWGQKANPQMPPSQVEATSTLSTYTNTTLHYSVSYPADFTLNNAFTYTELGEGNDINGVSLTIPTNMSQGTNLSSNSYISIESIATTTGCTPRAFLGDNMSGTPQTVTENGITYQLGKGGGAGAGNFYEEDVYAIQGHSPCIAVRYFIHSTNIGNYTPGTVTAFSEPALLSAFDKIRHSLILTK